MAQIQISVAISTKHGSEFCCELAVLLGECSEFCCDLFRETLLSIHIETLIPSGDGTIVYDKSLLQFRGTPADLQLLADRIVAAVYPDKCQADPDADTRSETDFQHQEDVDAR